MLAAGQAHLYFEPESKVVSRTNDECVVASSDQWYLAYGEESWCSAVKNHVLDDEKFNAYDATSLEKYNASLDWLKEWACTRQFGLGTFLPWDKQWVIESLSDSTIYMAYYTIAHYLQGEDNLNGDEAKSPSHIRVEDLTDDVFNFIYRKGYPPPATSAIPAATLAAMPRSSGTGTPWTSASQQRTSSPTTSPWPSTTTPPCGRTSRTCGPGGTTPTGTSWWTPRR